MVNIYVYKLCKRISFLDSQVLSLFILEKSFQKLVTLCTCSYRLTLFMGPGVV